MSCLSRALAYKLAQHMNVDVDLVRRENIRMLYEEFDDLKADEQLQQVENKLAMAGLMLPIARERLRLFFKAFVSTPRHQQLLAGIPADVSEWLSKDKVKYIRGK
eukprot:TRINITY_DN9691_c0_g1_i1.p1 TRINITY_DN9691_c0_g1~~TRINITY_DN9691_c0_g1_i1.p1  ORF type:complete len:105 (+),score=19.81 TRINITY_DN9691_c0_g1_i1:530-844(+)